MKTIFKSSKNVILTIMFVCGAVAAYASCTLRWSGTFTTSSGNTYTGTITATASTCEVAGAAIDKVITRYKNEM